MRIIKRQEYIYFLYWRKAPSIIAFQTPTIKCWHVEALVGFNYLIHRSNTIQSYCYFTNTHKVIQVLYLQDRMRSRYTKNSDEKKIKENNCTQNVGREGRRFNWYSLKEKYFHLSLQLSLNCHEKDSGSASWINKRLIEMRLYR